jgi:hypothetical protein
MLARRKQKPQDDEPLVPHGLISQALDDFPPAIENTPSLHPSWPAATEGKPSKAPPGRVLQWPQATQQLRNGVAIFRFIPRTIQKIREHLQISTRVTRVRNFASAGANYISNRIANAKAIPAALHEISCAFQAYVTRVRNLCSAYARQLATLSRVWSPRTMAYFRKRISAHRVKQPGPPIQLQRTTASKQYRLRIRLSGLPLRGHIILARAASEWRIKLRPLSRNSRLWTSVGMGAIASVFLMSLFSMARHYAQANLPSSRVAKASSQRSTSVIGSSTTPSRTRAPKAVSAVQDSPRVVVSAKPKPIVHKRQRPAVVSRRVIHHSEDEDYVAKDTYVYYGKNPSR